MEVDIETVASLKKTDNDDTSRSALRTEGIEDILERYFHFFCGKIKENGKQYFVHLDTKSFLRRLARSVVPKSLSESEVNEKPDFYGPLILSFCLSLALRLDQKKFFAMSETKSSYNMSTSLFISFGSLIIMSLLLDVAWQFISSPSSSSSDSSSSHAGGLDAALYLVGYSFFGPSLVIFFDERVHWFFFYCLYVVFGLSSSICLGLAAFRAGGRKQKALALGACTTLIHMTWLYMLRKSYANGA